MNLKRTVAQGAAVAVVLGGAGLGAGAVTATADPGWGPRDHDEWVDNDWNGHDFQWNRWNDRDWDKWWKHHRWRNDDRPPWGWGPPPAMHWRGHPPEWLDYWGYRVHPVWDPGFRAFGFWLFGVFIPVIVV